MTACKAAYVCMINLMIHKCVQPGLPTSPFTLEGEIDQMLVELDQHRDLNMS